MKLMAISIGTVCVVGVAILAAVLKLLTLSGAAAGLVVGVTIMSSGDWTLAAALFAFFFLASLATKLARRCAVEESAFTVDGFEMEEETEEGDDSAALEAAADDSRKGRTAMQVLAVGVVPAVLCALGAAPHMPLRAALGVGAMPFVEEHFRALFFAALACCLADSLASELGVLSATPPLLLTTLMPVKRGTDGAVSFLGTVASLLGGAIIGAFSGAPGGSSSRIACDATKFALIGALGCTIDSVLGCVVQPAPLMKRLGPKSWKLRNTLVNLLSVLATVGIVALYESMHAAQSSWVVPTAALAALAVLILVVFLSPLPGFWARKVLHLATALLVCGVVGVADSAVSATFVSTIAFIVLIAHSSAFTPLAPLWGRFQAGGPGWTSIDDDATWVSEDDEDEDDNEGREGGEDIGEYAEERSFSETFDIHRFEEWHERDAVITGLDDLSRAALVARAKECGVTASGTKKTLVGRLSEYFASMPTFEDWFSFEEEQLLEEAIAATELDEDEEEDPNDADYDDDEEEEGEDEDEDEDDLDLAEIEDDEVYSLVNSLDELEHATWIRAVHATNSGSGGAETAHSPGIFYFAFAVLILFNGSIVPTLGDINAQTALYLLGPMFFADPVAAIVGGRFTSMLPSFDTLFNITPPDAMKSAPKSVLPDARKTLSGALGFAAVCICWMKYTPLSFEPGSAAAAVVAAPLMQHAAIAFSLAWVELVSSELDNIVLPLIFGAFVVPTAAPVLVILTLAPIAFSSVAQTSLAAYWQFARPHTIIGTSLSIFVISALARGGFSALLETSESATPLIVALIASLHANVYIVGLNQMFDVDIDRLNKPYLPVASGEYPSMFGWALVMIHGIAAVLTATAFGSNALIYTVVGSGILGTLYSVPFGKCLRCSTGAHAGRWKGIPFLAAACIFIVSDLSRSLSFSLSLSLSLSPSLPLLLSCSLALLRTCMHACFLPLLPFPFFPCTHTTRLAGPRLDRPNRIPRAHAGELDSLTRRRCNQPRR